MYMECYGFEKEESKMRVQYPKLFSSGNFENEIYFKWEENCNTPKYTLVVFKHD